MAKKYSEQDIEVMAEADYQALTPYERRLVRGYNQGLSRAQARGHARVEKGEQPVSVVKPREPKPRPEPIRKRVEYAPTPATLPPGRTEPKFNRTVRTYSTRQVERQFIKDMGITTSDMAERQFIADTMASGGTRKVYFRAWNPHTNQYGLVYYGSRNTAHGITEKELIDRIAARMREAQTRGETLSFDEAFREQVAQDSSGYGGNDSPGYGEISYDFTQIEMYIMNY